METSNLIFFVNGKKVALENPNPEWTLLYFLRYELGLCGTKEGVALVLFFYQPWIEKQTKFSVNACLLPLCALHGTAIITVEGIGSVKQGVHPVQERIAKSHGTQCGFCTPGFVMSMYALLRNNSTPSEAELEEAFQGNLCRCTGYRPILSGFKTFCCKKNGDEVGGCCLDKKPNAQLQENMLLAHALYDTSEFKPYDPSQDVVFPSELILDSSLDTQNLVFKNSKVTFYRPILWSQLLKLKAEFPVAKILAGNTELGVDAKFKNEVPSVYIQITKIPELLEIRDEDGAVRVGAATTIQMLQLLCKERQSRPGTIFAALAEMIQWFAGPQIRNVATIAGNVITASPIADLNPILMATGSLAVLESVAGKRTVKMDSDFFNGYRRVAIDDSEILRSVILPPTKSNEFVWSAKQCRRREDDIAIVNTCMRIAFDEMNSSLIQNAVLVFGGMGPTTMLAKSASEYLVGKTWSMELVEKVSDLLVKDFPLTIDVPGGMPAYRQSLAISFFYKFFILVTDWLAGKGVTKLPSIDTREKSATLPCHQPETQEFQLYQIVSPDQSAHDLIGRPVFHLFALKHATGEAVFVDDIPSQKNELYGSLVFNRTLPYGKIISIDAAEALALPGVVAMFDSRSIPGNKLFGSISCDEPVFALGEVNAIGQTIALIVAKDQATAEKGAKLVKIIVEPLSPTILTIEDAIAHESYLAKVHLKNGDVEEVFRQSEHVLEGEVRVGGQEQFYLETQSCLAVPKEEDEMEIFLSTQTPVNMQRKIAFCLGVPQNRITVKTRRVGGSFGGKETRSALVGIPAAIAAQKLGVPVRIILNRYDDMEVTGHRNPYLFRYKVGFSSNGMIKGIRVSFFTNVGFAHDLCSAVIEFTTVALDGSFRIPNWEILGFACKTHLVPTTAMRGFGIPEGSLLLHTIFELVAAKLGRDSLEIRKLHLYKDGDLTHANHLLSDCTLTRCLEECLQKSDYNSRRKLVEEFNRANLWKKRGIAVTTTKHPVGIIVKFMNQAGALVMIHLDGSVTLNHGGMEMGQGLHTKMIQIATRVLGIPASKIYFSETSSDKVPNASPTCASISSDLNGMAVMNACNILMERLVPYKAANPEGKWEDWVSAAYYDQTNLSAVGFHKNADFDYDFATNSGRYADYISYGAAVSEVEIDCLTGDHSVLGTWIVMDVGESLNPAIDVGQIEGAFIQGYGLFVLEELLHSPHGTLLTKGPSSYKIPTMNDIPREFHVAILRGSTNPRAVYSSKAIGEPPLTLSNSIFFAIRNAICDARKDRNLSIDFPFDSPATCERIRLTCENELSVKPEEGINGMTKLSPWAIRL